MNLQPIIVYEAAPEPTTQTTISDLLLGVVWVVLALVVAAVVTEAALMRARIQ